ncbi:hypothetical protein APU01nite_08400 [Alkalibacterium putridalgicola]|uniref:Uncharacterized protein n=1 Tax=Alkalibacterium putridalgicola TaxID=426703 RepID=A0ABQ0UW95_9LACT|nr:hypothetical protein APU01nite_08400 [Alkalibacterium putridalgicola]
MVTDMTKSQVKLLSACSFLIKRSFNPYYIVEFQLIQRGHSDKRSLLISEGFICQDFLFILFLV